MTAEIAIMNKSAIALAADSKVTITNEASAKGYDSVNKLFTLSKRHPVAIMVYGNAEIMDVPWEVIIKEYRNAKIDRRDTIAEYADDFVNFIQNDIPMFDEASSKENVGRLVYSICSAALSEARIVATNSEFEIGSKEFVDLMADHIDLRADEVSETDDWMQKDEFEAF
ncbi:hypothetical protein A3711_09910 [Erythrobacter sp. HI00D59]|nr:hypothetical protein A3711_09910 [Erythrobacter sp. HI00D59]